MLNMGTYDYDLIVIGGGSGGLAASKVTKNQWSDTTASRIVILVMYIKFIDLQINIQYFNSILYLEDA